MRSAVRNAASRPAGCTGSSTASETARSICTPPMFRQYTPLSLDDVLVRAVMARRGASSEVMDIQPPPTVTARGDALQQRAPFSDRAAPRGMRSRPRGGRDAGEVALIGRPVDIAGWWSVISTGHSERGTRRTRLRATPFSSDDALLPRLAVCVDASIGRIGEYLVDRMMVGPVRR